MKSVTVSFLVGDIPCKIAVPMTEQNAAALQKFKSGSELDLHKVGYRAAKRISKIISQVYLLLEAEREGSNFEFEIEDMDL